MLDKVLGEINRVGNEKANASELTELKVHAAKLEGDIRLIEEKAAADLAIVKAALAETHGGKSGSEDWLNEVGKHLRGVYLRDHRGQESNECFKDGRRVADVLKTAVDMTTTTSATAGTLLPTFLLPGIRELRDIYGVLYPRVFKFNVPAGQTATINSESVRPAALVISAQNTSMTQEAAGRAYTGETVVPQLFYVYEQMANELVTNPSINFAATSVIAAVKSVNRKLEDTMLANGGSSDKPHPGVAYKATAKTTITSATLANVVSFLKECAAANAYAIDPTDNKIFLHPRDALALMAQTISDTNLPGALAWGDPRNGIPPRLFGYELIIHPGCNYNSNNYIFLGDPQNIVLAEAPGYIADFSGEPGFQKFQTAMRVGNHYDFVVTKTSEWFKAIVTA